MNDLRDLGQGSKMRAASPILVVAEPDKSSGDSWRRFLAILCFMSLYNLHGLEASRCPECGTELGTGPPTA